MTKLERLLKAWLQGCTELLLFAPALIALHAALPGRHALWPWLGTLSVLYAFGWFIRRAAAAGAAPDTGAGSGIGAIKAWLLHAAALLASALLAFAESGAGLTGAVQAAIGFAAAKQGMRSAGRGWDASFPVGAFWIGTAGYFAASLLFRFFDGLRPYGPWITWLGLAALALAIIKTNRATLHKETLSVQRGPAEVSPPTLWRNRLLVAGFLAAVLIVGSFRTLYEGAGAAGRQVTAAVVRFVRWMSSLLLPAATDQGPRPRPPQQDFRSLLGESKPSWFAVWTEKILYAATMALLAAAALLLVYLAIRNSRKWLARLSQWLSARFGMEEERVAGYVDEKKRLLDWEQWMRERTDRWKQWVAGRFAKEPAWEALADNVERVRRTYRRWLRRQMEAGYAVKPHLTPKETGRDLGGQRPLRAPEQAMLALYEQARYGGKAPDRDGVEPLRELYEGE